MTWVERKEIEKTAGRLRRVRLLELRIIDTRGQGMAVIATCCIWSRRTAEPLRLCRTRRRHGPWAPDRNYFSLNLKFPELRSRPSDLAIRLSFLLLFFSLCRSMLTHGLKLFHERFLLYPLY